MFYNNIKSIVFSTNILMNQTFLGKITWQIKNCNLNAYNILLVDHFYHHSKYVLNTHSSYFKSYVSSSGYQRVLYGYGSTGYQIAWQPEISEESVAIIHNGI